MIKGVHTMFYTTEPERLRAFIRDKLGFSRHFDAGGGWFIMACPEADMGCHPSADVDGGRSGTHQISFYCDDIHKTVTELKGRGVEFTEGVSDHGYGLSTRFAMPGGFTAELYQPLYARNFVS
jgi:catechol 2,3-dioxygenase-like lactoylglutathione lyase family enzyme